MQPRLLLIITFLLVFSVNSQSNDYPFELPDDFTASIDIETSNNEAFNNKLLGTNIFGFSKNIEKDIINRFDPITIRFPHGLWANWYDWRTDGTRVFGEETFDFSLPNGSIRKQTLDHLVEINIKDTSNIKIGINGLEDLNFDTKNSTGKGYDMLWTFNMSADGSNFDNGSPESVARYEDLINRGFEVKAIEMGNENFYPGQRSSIIPNTSDYIQRAKSMSAALKNIDPEIQVSIPLLRRENSANPTWNTDLTADQTYFDAVTVHTYVGSNPDDDNSPEGAYGTALTARHYLEKSVNDYAHKVTNKPVWLTEWGVNSGGANAASILGMADSYIFMSQNQSIYQRANWFSLNGKLNSFLVWEEYISQSGVKRPRIKYPLEKTAFGSSYEVIRNTFEDGYLLNSKIISPELISGVSAINARAITNKEFITLFIVNLTDAAVPFTIKVDGTIYNNDFEHHAMSFDHMGQERNIPIDTNPLTLIQEGSGVATLPKLSINTIVLKTSLSDLSPVEPSEPLDPSDDNSSGGGALNFTLLISILLILLGYRFNNREKYTY